MKLRLGAAPLLSLVCAATLVAGVIGTSAQAPQAPAPAAAGGGGGGRGGAGQTVFPTADTNRDGAITRAELKALLDKWFTDADTARSGSLTQDQLLASLNTAYPAPAPRDCGGNAGNGQTPCPEHVAAMMAALPATAPARPAQPRKVLVFAKAASFVHSSIPLAARTVEEMGKKYGTWTTTISYDPADINTQNLKQYDAIFLASTTGCFLDAPNDPAATAARRAALMEFVRSGKGLGGVHAATDSYHGNCGGRGGAAAAAATTTGAPVPAPAPAAQAAPAAARGGGGGGRGGIATQLAPRVLTEADKNADQKISRDEISALGDAWFDRLDTEKTGRIAQADFATRFNAIVNPPAPAGAGGRGGRGGGANAAAAPGANAAAGNAPAGAPANAAAAPAGGGGRGGASVRPFPEFSEMIGGVFMSHPFQHAFVKIDDPKSPLTAQWKGQDFEITDETYTMTRDSFFRDKTHVLISINVDKMSANERAAENRPWDHDYALSWIRKEGNGRVFYAAHGHQEAVYGRTDMLQLYLAGIQYALGDLKADDSPSVKK